MRSIVKCAFLRSFWVIPFVSGALLSGCNDVKVESTPVELSGEANPAPAPALRNTVTIAHGSKVDFDFGGNTENLTIADFEVLTLPRVLELSIHDGGRFSIDSPDHFIGSDFFEYRLVNSSDAAPVRIQITVYSDVSEGIERPQFLLPQLGLHPQELAVIVNVDDENSLSLAQEYMTIRNIPDENLFSVSLGSNANVSTSLFAEQTDDLLELLPTEIKAFALMFSAPYRVQCMSITSAFAFNGFDTKYCNTSGKTCGSTEPSGYFNSELVAADENEIRPAMIVSAGSFENAQSLIARGVSADHVFPAGDAYLVRTTDSSRSVRWSEFETTAQNWIDFGEVNTQYIDAVLGGDRNTLSGVDNVLFYLTGLTRVNELDTLAFVDGAVADHLTSFGGVLDSVGGQMHALEWIDAGVTASYGTVVEPCNYTTKFPRSDILLDRYYRGNSVVEAYWKSVAWPGEGVFVGEPLARPWGRQSLEFKDGTLTLKTTELERGREYLVTAADNLNSEFETILTVNVDRWALTEIVIENATKQYYRLE